MTGEPMVDRALIWLCAVVAAGHLLLFALLVFGALGGWVHSWRAKRRGRRDACGTGAKRRGRQDACGTEERNKPSTGAVNMKVRVGLVALMVIGLATISALQSGCTTGASDTLGNGQIDLPVEVSLEWHDNFGNGFTLVDGAVMAVTYRSMKTGVLYELTEKGGFLVTAPDGSKVRIRKKEEVNVQLPTPNSEDPTPNTDL